MSSLKMMSAVLGAAGLVATSANAELLTFDDISAAGGVVIPGGYAGLDWIDVYVVDAATADPGYMTGVVTAPNVAYSLIGVPASISAPSGFNLISGYFTAPYSAGWVTVTTTGGTNPQKSFQIDTTAPTHVIFDFHGITSATFSAQSNFALDNLTVTAVPESGTWGLMLLGLGIVGYQTRRRHRPI